MEKFNFKISNNVINHLGLNFYNSLPAVLYELIANSYDADASKVKIEIEKEENTKNKVYVFDNGIGMDEYDFENRYLELAKDSRLNITNSKRIKIGRKGLGKLSVYAISDTVCIFSKKINKDIIGMEINYKEAARTKSSQIYNPKVFNSNEIPDYIYDWFKKNEKGTITIINSCRRNFNKITLDKISTEIEKNFYLVLNNSTDPFNVSIIINNKEYITKKISPDFNCDFIFDFDKNDKIGTIETIYMDNSYKEKFENNWAKEDKDEKNNLFISTVYNQLKEKEENINIEIKGWIGTLDSLTSSEKNQRNVPLIVRNRVVKENIVNEYNIERFWTKYFVGELILDYMDITDIQDTISPNRQGFDSNVDDRYEKTKFIIEQIVKLLISKKDNREKVEINKKQQKIENYRNEFSKKIQNLNIKEKHKNAITNYYTNTTGLKIINEDYIIFISHCSKNRCIKSYEMGNYLFNIISEIKKNNNLKIQRIVYTSNKQHDDHVKAGEDIYDWMKNHALNEKYPNSIFISCISEEFLKNWNTIIEFGSAWVAGKKNYSFVFNRKEIDIFSSLSGIKKPLNLNDQSFDFNDNTDDLVTFLNDIFNSLISKEEISKIIQNFKFETYLSCANCLNLYNSSTQSIKNRINSNNIQKLKKPKSKTIIK